MSVLDLGAIEARYSAALDARPSKGAEIGSDGYTALTDSVADIPALLAELAGLQAQLAAVRVVYALQAPLQPRSSYIDKGAYWAHQWWLNVLGGVLAPSERRARAG